MTDSIIITVLVRAIAAGTPLLLATMGEIVAERSGVLNLGVEGMMAAGAVTAYLAALSTGCPWPGVAAAIAAGTALALLHACVAVTLGANQVVSGLALSMIGVGASGLLGKPHIGRPLGRTIDEAAIPGLADLPVVGRILFRQAPLSTWRSYWARPCGSFCATRSGACAFARLARTRGPRSPRGSGWRRCACFARPSAAPSPAWGVLTCRWRTAGRGSRA